MTTVVRPGRLKSDNGLSAFYDGDTVRNCLRDTGLECDFVSWLKIPW